MFRNGLQKNFSGAKDSERLALISICHRRIIFWMRSSTFLLYFQYKFRIENASVTQKSYVQFGLIWIFWILEFFAECLVQLSFFLQFGRRLVTFETPTPECPTMEQWTIPNCPFQLHLETELEIVKVKKYIFYTCTLYTATFNYKTWIFSCYRGALSEGLATEFLISFLKQKQQPLLLPIPRPFIFKDYHPILTVCLAKKSLWTENLQMML